MNAIDTLLARQACADLMTDYCTYLDERKVEAFVALFEPQAALRKMSEPTHVATGHAEIARTLQARPASLLSRHLLVNATIRLDGDDRAHGEAYGMVVRGVRDRETWPMPIRGLELLVQYKTSFRRGADGWRISDCAVYRVLDIEAVR